MRVAMGAHAGCSRPAVLPQSLCSKTFVANTAPLRHSVVAPVQQSRGTLQVHNALSRKGKEDTMEKLIPLLTDSTVVVGLRYMGLTVKQMQQLRTALPKEGATLLVCKNTLLRRAADEVPGWADLKDVAKGDNAWLFIQEEQVSASIKAYIGFQNKLREGVPKDQRDDFTLLDPSGGCMSGKGLNPAEVRRLEKLPTRLELITTIARLIKQVPTKVAVSVKQVPTKLAYGVKALADADDNKDLIVGDVLPKAEA